MCYHIGYGHRCPTRAVLCGHVAASGRTCPPPGGRQPSRGVGLWRHLAGQPRLRACSSRCGHLPAKYCASWASVSMPNVITHQDGRCKGYLFTTPKQRFVLTTDSQHGYAMHPNFAARLDLTGVNLLWVADITYLRLRETFL